VPPENEARAFKRFMSYFPTPASSPASYPSFHPHVTLASIPTGSDLSETIRELHASLPRAELPVAVRFTSLEHGNHYFRSVYAAVEPTPALNALRAHIHTTLHREPNTPNYLHMSIYYIADVDEARRWEATERLEAEGLVVRSSSGDGIMLDCGRDPGSNKNEGEKLSGFMGTYIWIVHCDGPVGTWSVKEKIALGP
jgi:2',3'-cyclic-nucleotide 3'-phosphodiesterase